MNRMIMRQIVYAALVLFFVCPIFGNKISLKNYAGKPLWVYIKKLGPGGVDWSAKDYEAKLISGGTLETSGDIPAIWVVPMSTDMSLDEFKDRIKKETGAKDAIAKLCELAEIGGSYQAIGDGNWTMSFDEDTQNKKQYLYFGRFKVSQPFEFLEISDMHTIAKSEADLKKMNMNNYGGEEKRASQLDKFKKKAAVRDRMISFINDKSKNVQAAITPGDGAGGYGKESDTQAFKAVWYNPLESALQASTGGDFFVGIGNHDTYWSSVGEKKPTKMLRFLKSKFGKSDSYLYAFNIGPVRFIHLGLYPTANQQQNKNLKTKLSSLAFLTNELNKSIGQPVVIYFHYPIHGSSADWWSKVEKNAFYNVIRNYNVIAILNGHAHGSAAFDFRGKCPSIRAGGNDFAEFRFDPAKSNEITFNFVDAEGQVRTVKPTKNAPEPDLEEEGE